MLATMRRWIRDEGLFLADFWNSATLCNGCLSAGRKGGYIYIDWNGNVMPCVFIPYSTHNIKEVYENGGDISTVLTTPFLRAIREWQTEYGYMQPSHQVGNEITPCPIRDHHRRFYQIVKEQKAKPINPEAREALESESFVEGLCRYGRRVAELTDGIWDKEYLEPERKRSA